ncbi:MAG: hypothetical protein AAF764_03860 [Pseudomonadota bacterium]
MTYEQWEHCITVECGLELTPDYVEQRIAALQDKSDFHTQKFVKTWGEKHRATVLARFQEAQQKLAQ